MSEERPDRGVDIELLAPEIEALRETAVRFTHALEKDSGAAGAGLDLETAAIRYVRKLDDEQRKVNETDYAALFERVQRDKENSGN
jgi:hypothetical protein